MSDTEVEHHPREKTENDFIPGCDHPFAGIWRGYQLINMKASGVEGVRPVLA